MVDGRSDAVSLISEIDEIDFSQYPAEIIEKWNKRKVEDTVSSKYSADALSIIHSRGYLAKNVEQNNIFTSKGNVYMSDFAKIFLLPYNNGFTKWMSDIYTSTKLLQEYQSVCRDIYFSIIKRNGISKVYKTNCINDKEYTIDDIILFLKHNNNALLRPSQWNSSATKYYLRYENDTLFINDSPSNLDKLNKVIDDLQTEYILYENIDFLLCDQIKHYIQFYVANEKNEVQILDVYIYTWCDKESNKQIHKVDENGSFELNGKIYHIDDWQKTTQTILNITKTMGFVSFFTISISANKGELKLIHLNCYPILPDINMSEKLNDYLLYRAEVKLSALKDNTFKQNHTAIRQEDYSEISDVLNREPRIGMRAYMYGVWQKEVIKDYLDSFNSLEEKRWAWDRGFLSYRINEYGLTEENYKNFISDYDYQWLNRINNDYQVWISDKVTYRKIFEPFKQLLPKYYYFIYRSNWQINISKLNDCPTHLENSIWGILQLLKQVKKLALKASYGSHGFGFFVLSYVRNQFYINDDAISKEDLMEKLSSLNTNYLITEYIKQHSQMNKFYSKSINTIRLHIVNEQGYNPIIMQSLMRIGTNKTGYVDNGGLYAMIHKDTGRIYRSGLISLKNKQHLNSDIHPDTKIQIKGTIPHWQQLCDNVIDICRFYPELEYLGFDVAITPESFKIIEINVYPDLFNVYEYAQEYTDYLNKKLSLKRQQYQL
ncbi:sugar-transfer associated ATP-grasp domain-containing protein [Pasteurella atlantica]|uniref:Sugar-transfer associated ATP-grasp domain-containing protein n=2 Tax=Pasteurellaceae TaxID=712 RepID=A0ACC6HNC2_9PAST|nr:sugar-transfer associated ATP-grasp domain-containing protein [Pasteurella atlantica]MDP8052298.1 sugar-transfer associated ATP-grasp domain-containing protein [Pasteurella atlantica]MDP8101763.1 sugar-transfer associated ATP-grasp domain-containing protein [Pasteurella atlantica]MDP8105792.1 sugar-transfer associated ATP-grasp domain-containing protein [Pasteurella atlantica]MDP8149143.1 sugar-transfer associated ATP-grasp domain-containing protein [Pasteurella atlantica]